MSQLENSRVVPSSGEHVVRVKMKPALSDSRIAELMNAGIGIIDFDSGTDVSSDSASDDDKGGATRSFASYRSFTREGGYGALVDENHQKTVLGFARGPCGMFLEEEYAGSKTVEKAFQFDRYVVIDDPKGEYQDLYEMLRRYDQLQSMSNVTDDKNRDIIYDAFHEAERAGDVVRSL